MKRVFVTLFACFLGFLIHNAIFWFLPILSANKHAPIAKLEDGTEITPPQPVEMAKPKTIEPAATQQTPETFERKVPPSQMAFDRPSAFAMDLGIAASPYGEGAAVAAGGGTGGDGQGAGGNAVVFEPGDVDVVAKVLTEVLPEYPARAQREGINGRVEVLLVVEPNGRVGAVDLLSEEPSGYGFGRSAVTAMKRFTFSPARKEGVAVRMRFRKTFRFGVDE
jgi:TonB family protein